MTSNQRRSIVVEGHNRALGISELINDEDDVNDHTDIEDEQALSHKRKIKEEPEGPTQVDLD